MREIQRDNHQGDSIDQEGRDRKVRGGGSSNKKERKSADRKKGRSRKKYSLSKNKVHPINMANGSEATLSPTVDSSVKGTVDRKKEKLAPQPIAMKAVEESPHPKLRLTTTVNKVESSDDDNDSGSDEQDENLLAAVPESTYTSDSDPYIYSDDSESLSDAYFRPSFNDYPAVLYPRSNSHGSFASFKDEHMGGRAHALETDSLSSLPPHPHSTTPHHHYSTAPLGYGSVPSMPERAPSPFTKSTSIASILEDSPVDEEQPYNMNGDTSQLHQQYYSYPSPAAAADMDAEYLKQNKKERRRNRKQQKAAARHRQMQIIQNQQKQREQAVRERTVAEVKGRPQDETQYRDSIFAYIFIVQLLLVLALATSSASTVMFAKEAPAWGTLTHTAIDGKSSSSTKTTTNTATSTKLMTTTNKGTRRLLDRIFGEGDVHHLHLKRRLHSGSPVLFDTGSSTSSTNSTDDADGLATDDTIYNDGDNEQTSTSRSKSHPEMQPMISTKTASASSATSGEPASFTIDYRNAIALIGASGIYACVLSYLSFGFMLIMSRALIHVTLVFSILLSVAWGMLGLTIDPYGMISIMGFGALLLTLAYTIYNWQRVPFASTNLHTALCAMRCTSDITILGMAAIMVSFAWCILWSMAFIGSVDMYDPGKCTNQRLCLFEVPMLRIGLYGFFIISFYWTNTVIKNILRVTVASTIGTWWYYPQEISPFCSSAVGQPLIRSLTKSLGSICMGSLISQAVQVTYAVGQCFCCMSNCQRHAVPSICDGADENSKEVASTTLPEGNTEVAPSAPATEQKKATSRASKKYGSYAAGNQLRCFNRWAYTYIGLYGYGFSEGGEKAIQLFEAREWTDVVRDNLINNVLMMASVVIGGSTGCFAVLAEEVDGYEFTTLHTPITTAFLIGFVLGLVLSNVLLLGVVGSAVNTVLVCFAAGPFEFNKNHPRLSREMREVWSQQVWEPSA